MFGRIGSKYTWPLYWKYLFRLATTNLLGAAAFGKILHILATCIGVLQMFPLILEISPFPLLFSKAKFSWI